MFRDQSFIRVGGLVQMGWVGDIPFVHPKTGRRIKFCNYFGEVMHFCAFQFPSYKKETTLKESTSLILFIISFLKRFSLNTGISFNRLLHKLLGNFLATFGLLSNLWFRAFFRQLITITITIIYLTTLTSKSTKCSFKIRTCIKLSKIHIHMKY